MESKTCRGCGATKPLDGYYLKLGKRTATCKECQKADRRVYYDRNHRVAVAPSGHPCAECGDPVPPKKVGGKARKFCTRACATMANARDAKSRQRYYILARYGITEADYEKMVVRQGGRCAVCGTADPATQSGNWHVDHCHFTGIVRGLLCTRCNIGLGQFMDDPERLWAALRYLGVDMVHAKKKSGDPDFDDKVPLVEQVLTTVKGPNGEDLVVSDALGTVTQAGGHASVDPVAVVDDRPDAKNADVPDDVVTADKAATGGDWPAAGGPITSTVGPAKTPPAKSATTDKKN